MFATDCVQAVARTAELNLDDTEHEVAVEAVRKVIDNAAAISNLPSRIVDAIEKEVGVVIMPEQYPAALAAVWKILKGFENPAPSAIMSWPDGYQVAAC